MSALVEGARALAIQLAAGQVAQLDQLGAFLRERNREVNLTRIVEPEAYEVKHVLDSLTAAVPLLERLHAGEAPRLIDVGAGAGFPGLPLKIAFPRVRLTLLEATGKKARFLRDAVHLLGLEGVEVLGQRAEEAGRDDAHRDGYAWATARALGPLPVVIELCAPFLAPGGLLVAQRRGSLDAELESAARAFGQLKMWSRVPIPVQLPGLDDGRGLVVGEKYGPTPSKYPRRSGMPKKEPLA